MKNNKYNLQDLIDISNELNRTDLANDLLTIKQKLNEPNKKITIPLVGEFSSGKTSLINSLIENNLETASKATTATIFEIHFGSDKNYANIISEDKSETIISDFSDLRNSELQNTQIVQVYDSSELIPSSTIIVDTPGLSSNDPKHKLALTSYLPFSDAIFLVTDINQQLTRTLLEFIESINFVDKPVYLIITKSDTKTEKEISEAKIYAIEQISKLNLKVEDTIVISSAKSNMSEFFELIQKIQINKNEIVIKVLQNRIQTITDDLLNYITQLIKSTESPDNLELEVDKQESKLENLYKNIDKLIKDSENILDEKSKDCIRIFSSKVYNKLETIVKEQGRYIDQEVYAAVNITAKQTTDILRKDIQNTLSELAKKRKSSLENVPLQFLESIDLSMLSLPEFSYDINLSEIGHQYDKQIGYAVIAAAVVTAIALTAGAAAPAAGAATSSVAGGSTLASTVGTAATTANVLNVVDSATDVGSIVSNTRTVTRMKDMLTKTATVVNKGKKIIDQTTTVMENFTPQQKGIIETSVGWATDQFAGKPQRRKAINNYIENVLNPEFTLHMNYIRMDVCNTIKELLIEEAQTVTEQMKITFQSLLEDEKTSKQSYTTKINTFKSYKNILINYGN